MNNTNQSFYMGDPLNNLDVAWEQDTTGFIGSTMLNYDTKINNYSYASVPLQTAIIVNPENIKIKEDQVNHPSHYTSHPSGIECIQVTEHYNFCVGNAIKYLWRNGLKNEVGKDSKEKQIQDLEKAIWYITREIRNLKHGTYE